MKTGNLIQILLLTLCLPGGLCSGRSFSNIELYSQSEEETCPGSVLKNGEQYPTDYASDWKLFKKAVKEKDQKALAARCTENIEDFEGLIFMLSELFIMKKMDETSFRDLEKVMFEDGAYLKFYAEDKGIDEQGHEYATSVTLHFTINENGLFLDHYSAAG